jgi:predicted ribonuclease YlaK
LTTNTTRPMPLLQAEADRIIRWLDDIETELKRICDQDEWDDKSIPRIVVDTSAIVLEGQFDTFDWEPIVNNVCVRLIVPILVIRELDNLKNFGKEPKARRRLRRIQELLDGKGRGPAQVRPGVTIELLMNPPRHSPLPINDEEIVSRAMYVKGRRGGAVKLISGDYRLVLTAQAEGMDAQITPAELKQAAE